MLIGGAVLGFCNLTFHNGQAATQILAILRTPAFQHRHTYNTWKSLHSGTVYKCPAIYTCSVAGVVLRRECC